MASLLRCGTNVHGLQETLISLNTKTVNGFCTSLNPQESKSKFSPNLSSDILGKPISVSDKMKSRNGICHVSPKSPTKFCVHAQASICVSKNMRWWDKTLKPNMVEINSGQQLVDSLHNAGDRLVIIDFYSPGCGGCKSLHPKICQMAESNPKAVFLKVNYEKLQLMCHTLHIHVLPFFRFYRGAEGRLCSFSCTNATIKKFKDALAKHGSERCSLGPAKGLDESELVKLASVGELSLGSPLMGSREERLEDLFIKSLDFSGVLNNDLEVKDRSSLF